MKDLDLHSLGIELYNITALNVKLRWQNAVEWGRKGNVPENRIPTLCTWLRFINFERNGEGGDCWYKFNNFMSIHTSFVLLCG